MFIDNTIYYICLLEYLNLGMIKFLFYPARILRRYHPY